MASFLSELQSVCSTPLSQAVLDRIRMPPPPPAPPRASPYPHPAHRPTQPPPPTSLQPTPETTATATAAADHMMPQHAHQGVITAPALKHVLNAASATTAAATAPHGPAGHKRPASDMKTGPTTATAAVTVTDSTSMREAIEKLVDNSGFLACLLAKPPSPSPSSMQDTYVAQQTAASAVAINNIFEGLQRIGVPVRCPGDARAALASASAPAPSPAAATAPPIRLASFEDDILLSAETVYYSTTTLRTVLPPMCSNDAKCYTKVYELAFDGTPQDEAKHYPPGQRRLRLMAQLTPDELTQLEQTGNADGLVPRPCLMCARLAVHAVVLEYQRTSTPFDPDYTLQLYRNPEDEPDGYDRRYLHAPDPTGYRGIHTGIVVPSCSNFRIRWDPRRKTLVVSQRFIKYVTPTSSSSATTTAAAAISSAGMVTAQTPRDRNAHNTETAAALIAVANGVSTPMLAHDVYRAPSASAALPATSVRVFQH